MEVWIIEFFFLWGQNYSKCKTFLFIPVQIAITGGEKTNNGITAEPLKGTMVQRCTFDAPGRLFRRQNSCCSCALSVRWHYWLLLEPVNISSSRRNRFCKATTGGGGKQWQTKLYKTTSAAASSVLSWQLFAKKINQMRGGVKKQQDFASTAEYSLEQNYQEKVTGFLLSCKWKRSTQSISLLLECSCRGQPRLSSRLHFGDLII